MGLKLGGPSIAAAHEGQKVGGPRPARPNSFRRLCWTQSAAKLLAVTEAQSAADRWTQAATWCRAYLCDIRTFTLSIVSINWIHRRTTHFWLSSTTTKFSDVSHVLGSKLTRLNSTLPIDWRCRPWHCTALPLPVHHCFLVLNLKCAILC